MRWCALAVTVAWCGCGRFGFDPVRPPDAREVLDAPDIDAREDAVCGVIRELSPQGLYSSDFNRDVDGWEPTEEFGNPVGYMTPMPGDDWGGVENEYWGGPVGAGDRMLSMHRSGLGKQIRWRRKLTNSTGLTVTEVRLTFDVEAVWWRFPGTGAGASPRLGRIWWWLDEVKNDAVVQIDNAGVAPERAASWLCDAEMDAASTSRRGTEVVFSGVSIAPAAELTLHFGFWERFSLPDERNVNVGVDNLIVSVQ